MEDLNDRDRKGRFFRVISETMPRYRRHGLLGQFAGVTAFHIRREYADLPELAEPMLNRSSFDFRDTIA